jgi:carbon storage regulator
MPRTDSYIDTTRGRTFLPDSPYGWKEFAAMLVLTRKLNETIIIDGNISVTVVGIRGNQVRLGICAPRELGVYRSELCERAAAGKNGGSVSPPELEPAVN